MTTILSLSDWRIVAAQTIVTIEEVSKLLKLVEGHVKSKDRDVVETSRRKLILLRYRLEVEMFNQTGTQDCTIFDPEQVRV